MPKQIYDQIGKQFVTTTAPPTSAPNSPKTTPDAHQVVQIAGSYSVCNAESGSEVARFSNYGDALNEAVRRNTISQARGLT